MSQINLTNVENFQKSTDLIKIKGFGIPLKRIDDCLEIRDSTPYIEDIRVVGEPNPSPDWMSKLEAKVEAQTDMDLSADISTHKMVTRRNKCQIEVLMPERTRGIHKRHFIKKKSMAVTEHIERQLMFEKK